jgi:hypothetical protein
MKANKGMSANVWQSNSGESFSMLPPHATQASRLRYEIALSLANMAPPAFGQERILTGSTSRGIADEYSDIEMMFYVDAIPSYAQREQWLQTVGARDIVLDHEKPGEQEVWATFYVHDIWVEAGWRVIAAHEQDLANLVAGNVTAHIPLMLAWITIYAVPLQSAGALARWQLQLTHYPETLPQKIIDSVNEYWTQPQGFAIRWALLKRCEPMALTNRLLADIWMLLRILFAINHQWEPDWKWLRPEAQRLTIKPDHLVERINELFTKELCEQTVVDYLLLIRDTLLLVPSFYSVTIALANVRESLRAHGFEG